jgi:hypothetical protein
MTLTGRLHTREVMAKILREEKKADTRDASGRSPISRGAHGDARGKAQVTTHDGAQDAHISRAATMPPLVEGKTDLAPHMSISTRELELGNVLGEGTHGRVFLGPLEG